MSEQHTQRVLDFLWNTSGSLQDSFDELLKLADDIQRESARLRAELDTASAKYQHVLTERDDARAELEAAKVIVQAKSSGLTIAVFENHRLTKELEKANTLRVGSENIKTQEKKILLDEVQKNAALRAKVERYEKALNGIPHTCHHHPHLECAGCTAREAVGDNKEGQHRE
mgnify:CR=1 FL=1